MSGRDGHRLDPSLFGLRLSGILRIYRVRLRRHAIQELLAAVGISIGVALVFGVLIANTSIVGSARRLINGVTGSARLQLAARSPEGFDESIANKAANLRGVAKAVPLLREDATIQGTKGRESIQLVGVTPTLIGLHSIATRSFSGGIRLISGGVGLTESVAKAVGAKVGGDVTMRIDGQARRVAVNTELGEGAIGPVAESPVAVQLLSYAQKLSGKRRRVTQVLIEPRRGKDALVASELRKLAKGKIDVLPAKQELAVLAQAARPLDQSTALFVAISAMVGFLLALNAMLITLPGRRRNIAEMVVQGFDRRQMLLVLGSQAVVLGTIASIVGIGLGYLLASTIYFQPPVYLATAFPVYFHRSVHVGTVLVSLLGGVLAALICAYLPMYPLRSGARPSADAVLRESGESGQRISVGVSKGLATAGVALVLGATLLAELVPALTVLAGVMLAIAVPCLTPGLFMLVLSALAKASRRMPGSMLTVATIELRATATRSVALIGVTALAVYGSVAIETTRHDLTTGLDSAVTEYLDTAQVWVSENDNFLTVDGFPEQPAKRQIANLPDVASVRVYRGALLDVGNRRLWVRARPSADSKILQGSQLLSGSLRKASAEIRSGGWAAVSNVFAAERGLKVGGRFTLPTPAGEERVRVAAITTNVGWTPGAITINSADYARWWRTSAATALEVSLKRGVSAAKGRSEIAHALGPNKGLVVETEKGRERSFEATAREGLRSLGNISTLLLLTASLAVASALGAAIWQRRDRLAAMKTQGFDSVQLLRSLLMESLLAVVIGCFGGACVGIYGHALANRWLTQSTGFPAPLTLGASQLLLALVVIVAITVAMVALPGWSAAKVPPSMGLQE